MTEASQNADLVLIFYPYPWLQRSDPSYIYPIAMNFHTGRIHSVETCGTVDGPGVRFVIFTQGCPLRCLYCHNPDSHFLGDGTVVTVDDLIAEIKTYRSYIRPPGGITISGGEPLVQPHFIKEIFRRCQELGIHTALDTSGYCDLAIAQNVLPTVDLVLLDIKSFDPEIYWQVTQGAIAPTLQLARYLSDIHKPVWIRFVLVPGLTDAPHNLQGLAQFISTLTNVERVEILPFHKMGEYKWQQLGADYSLAATPIPSAAQMQAAATIFRTAAQGHYPIVAVS